MVGFFVKSLVYELNYMYLCNYDNQQEYSLDIS